MKRHLLIIFESSAENEKDIVDRITLQALKEIMRFKGNLVGIERIPLGSIHYKDEEKEKGVVDSVYLSPRSLNVFDFVNDKREKRRFL
jgi:hypothetical protein|nr:MAG TPA: hypothetical protein [Caudoviricetes sp.]